MFSIKNEPVEEACLISGLRSEIVMATIIVDQVFSDFKFDCRMGSGIDSNHSRNSLHFSGAAGDYTAMKDGKPIGGKRDYVVIAERVRQRLGKEFDVIPEDTHLHIEFQPNFVAIAKDG